jgi:hypothetical protein
VGKFKRKIRILFGKEADFLFYRKSGVWGMYSFQLRRYCFCIPFVVGFSYSTEWGNSLY